MGPLRKLRARWRARRQELPYKQIEADRAVPDLKDQDPVTDGVTGTTYAGQRALGAMLNPKAKSRTEWRGD